MKIPSCAVFLAVFALSLPSFSQSDRVQLEIDKGAGGLLTVSWQDSCARGDTDYAVYEGLLGSFSTHGSIQCTTSGASVASVNPVPGSAYYLVVPEESGAEGSYGLDSALGERPTGAGACNPQQSVRSCAEDNFVDADPARVARLDQVLGTALALIDGGGSYTDVANMLSAQSDVDAISSNGVSLFFRVDGLSTSIYDAAAARRGAPLHEVIPPSGRASSSERAGSGLASPPIPAASVEPILPRGQRVVGIDDDNDGFRDIEKFALILSPYAFAFPNDSAPRVKTILDGVEDYQNNRVTYKENNVDLISSAFTLSDYINGWQDQDIIFISSHGEADADAPWGPEPVVFLGIGGATCADLAAKAKAEIPDPAMRPGLGCHTPINLPGGNTTTRDIVGLTPFWEFVHGGNLDKKVIWMDACRTAAHPGLAEALTGTDSVFFGWSDVVFDSVSADVAEWIIEDSAGDAFPILRSFVWACADGSCREPLTDPTPAELLGAWHRADLRTREGLNLLSTPVQGFCGVSPSLPVSQTCPSCGGAGALSVNYSISVEGLEADDMTFIQDPLEFAKYQLRLFADVDNLESGFALPLTDLNMVETGDGIYTDSMGIMMAIDNICPFETVTYRPWVLLPAFDEAMPGNDGRDRMYSWDDPFTVEVIPTQLP